MLVARHFLVVFAASVKFISVGESANILSIFPVPSKSHDILGNALSKHLASMGHNVTYISAFPQKRNIKNFHLIHVEELDTFKEKMRKYVQGNGTTLEVLQLISQLPGIASIVFEDKAVQELIKSDSKFDVIIHLLGLDATLALAHRFNVPVIVFAPIGGFNLHNKMMANPAPSSYISTMVTPYNEDMTFLQRISNTVVPFIFFNVLDMMFKYAGNVVIKTHFPGYPTLQEIVEQRADLILVNSDVSTETPRPYVPNVIQVGGFHLQKPEPLDADLKKVLDDAKNGFVYFSFGTNANVKELPQIVLDVFKKVLGIFPFKIIMKYEDETMAEQPANFYLQKWFPQLSVLAHPNAKLFISHGGYGGITESLYCGVPIVCIPLFGDQPKNCAEAEHSGHSVRVDLETINEEVLSDVLQKALYNETFREIIRFKSELYKDQPMNPMDKAVYWIEHVIKHKGAKHLKVKGIQLPWYQYHSIDVYLFLGFVTILLLLMSIYSCKVVCKRLCSLKHKVKTH